MEWLINKWCRVNNKSLWIKLNNNKWCIKLSTIKLKYFSSNNFKYLNNLLLPVQSHADSHLDWRRAKTWHHWKDTLDERVHDCQMTENSGRLESDSGGRETARGMEKEYGEYNKQVEEQQRRVELETQKANGRGKRIEAFKDVWAKTDGSAKAKWRSWNEEIIIL